MLSNRFFKVLILVLLVITAQSGVSMAIFKGKEAEAVLFSPLSGYLTYKGSPASHARINLWVAWKDLEGEMDYYEADANGFFSIPEKRVKYRENPLAQMSIGQIITVTYKDHEVVIWKAGKSSTNLYGELGGAPVGVRCELTESEMHEHLDYSLLETKCVWEFLRKEGV